MRGDVRDVNGFCGSVAGLAPGSRPDQNVTASRPRGLELVVLDQQPGELPFHLDQAIGALFEIGRGRGGAHGAGEYRFTADFQSPW